MQHSSLKQAQTVACGKIAEAENNILGGDYINFEVYASGSLASSTDMLDSVLDGVADVGFLQVAPSRDAFL
jgi:TRAP-type C4-dicarboxylate transport system substrate-binding protein